MKTNFTAASNPMEAINKISYPGQPLELKQYAAGYENYFNSIPKLQEDEELEENIFITKEVMKVLGSKLEITSSAFNVPDDGKFERTIIALEEPLKDGDSYTAGSQIVVAQWGKGFTSPIHGHNTGYMHEQIIEGRLKVNTYRIVDEEKKIVRFHKTEIHKKGVIVSEYAPHNERNMHEQQTLVHNMEAIEPSLSLHYLPTYNKDGMGNTFTLEEFGSLWRDQVIRIDSREGLYSQPGDVILVRSTNVPEYGDHFIVITGPPIMKEHGFRPMDHSIGASANHSKLLDMFPLRMGLTLLKLNKQAAEAFHKFHGIVVKDREVIFDM